MLWVALHLPRLPLVALTTAIGFRPAESVAVVEGAPRSLILVPDRRAETAGIVTGMTLASALALLPTLKPLPRDHAAEAQVQHRVALCACQFSSQVSVALPQCVLLEVSSSIRLFGGVRAMVKVLTQQVRQLGVLVWPAAAPTARAAWCLASTAKRTLAINKNELAQALNSLPVMALQTVQGSTLAEAKGTRQGREKGKGQGDALDTLGIRTLDELRALDRAGLARRFGEAVLAELDHCYGDQPEALPHFVVPTEFSETVTLPVPIADLSMLQFVFARISRSLCGFLHLRGLGVTRIVLRFRHEDVEPTSVVIGLGLTRSEAHVLSVIRERLQHVVLPAAAEAVSVTGEECAPLASAQTSLLPDTEAIVVSDDVIDRIRARVPKEHIYRLVITPDHRPECAYRERSYGESQLDKREAKADAQAEVINAPRPLWLLRSAKPLRSPPQAAGYDLLTGPERIEAGWWDGGQTRRDYFVAQAQSGQRCWLYRNDAGQWFVHGFFA